MTNKQQVLGPRQQALVDALRSGDYQQATNRLRVDNKFCCLGVACDLMNKGGWTLSAYNSWLFGDDPAALPDAAQKYYGFRDDNGGYSGGEKSLSSDNDNGASFHEIAAIIEAHAAELFTEPR